MIDYIMLGKTLGTEVIPAIIGLYFGYLFFIKRQKQKRLEKEMSNGG